MSEIPFSSSLILVFLWHLPTNFCIEPKKFQDDEGHLDIDEASEFISTYIPKRGEWKAIQNRIVTQNERVKFLGRVSINIDIKTQEVSFALPDFGLGYKDTYIPPEVWESCSDELLRSEEAWVSLNLAIFSPATIRNLVESKC